MVIREILFGGMQPVTCKYENIDKQTYNNPCVWSSVRFYLVVCNL